MISVLVVEDDPEKLRRVLVGLAEVPGCGMETIDSAHDATGAKAFLREKSYDLLVLDIALPQRPDKIPSPNGGIELLEEVLERDIYHKPRHIVGLTAYPDILEVSGPRFAEDLWLVILYDAASDSWLEQLRRRVRHIILAEKDAPIPAFGVHLCIVTALHDPELTAILALPWEWEKKELPHDGTIYHLGHFRRSGETFEVVAASLPRMGMPAAAVQSAKMISAFRPRYLAMTGVLAGMPGQCDLGDIIVADPSWDYGSGKWRLQDGAPFFEPAPYQIGLNSFIRGKVALMAHDGSILDEIRRTWPGPKPTSALRMHVGPVASGAAVLAAPEIWEAVKPQHRKLLGIEMETYGVLAAADASPLPQPKAFSMKSVCDFAGPDKNDHFQAYAAFTSAQALRIFVERVL